jgi:molecular chaperone GrpE
MENKQESTVEIDTKEVPIERETISEDKAVESETDKLVKELQDKVADITDKYMRVAAELDNTRKRSQRDAESAARTCGMGVAKKFLPVMDACEQALKHTPDDAGIKSLSLALESAFAQIGIVKIESVGQQLNPQFHNAISVVPADDAHPANTITEEMQTGYMYGDTVLRPAMVIVSK